MEYPYKILVLGKGNSGEGVHRFFEYMDIWHDFLDTNEVKDTNYQLVIKSPGIDYQNEVIKKLKGIKMITDIELIGCLIKKDYIAITGTNGKTTTTTYINSILRTKYKSISCGNIGYSLGDAALGNHDIFVTELSSFQLCGVKSFHPHIAIILNLSAAHLDFHQTKENYYQAKMKMLINQTEEEIVLYNGDDVNISKYLCGKGKKISFGLNSKNDFYYLFPYLYHKGRKVLKITDQQFIYCKIAAAIVGLFYRIKKKTIINKLNNNYLPYRSYHITNNIINDAKSTNISSTVYSLANLRNVHLICGGLDRGEDLNELKNYLSNIIKVYAYGQTRNKIAEFMISNNIPCVVEETLSEVIKSVQIKDNEVILYSPFMASWDQYKSYQERGREFDELIKKEGFI